MAEGRWNPDVDLAGDREGVEGDSEDVLDVVAIIDDNKCVQKERAYLQRAGIMMGIGMLFGAESRIYFRNKMESDSITKLTVRFLPPSSSSTITSSSRAPMSLVGFALLSLP